MFKIESTSHLWHRRFVDNRLPKDGTVLEVAPGYEPKIGNALALYKFRGTVFVVEPDQKAAYHIQTVYKKILPLAFVQIIIKPLQDVEIGVDVPCRADALVASHPFDDMVIASIIGGDSLFSKEKDDGLKISFHAKGLYDAITDEDYARGIEVTVRVWEEFIQKSRPALFIASQYPSHMLTVKGLIKRQNSGYAVLDQLKSVYKDYLAMKCHSQEFGYKGDARWWIVAKKRAIFSADDLERQPLAIERLGQELFVPQRARRLDPNKYEMVYVDKQYFRNLNPKDAIKKARDFAIALNQKNSTSETIMAYADRQKDKTDIGLSGNLGSGRAIYYGDRFNILGVGRTTLCKSRKPGHRSGKLEIVGAMRRIILSSWISYFIPERAIAHPVLIALKETRRYKWNLNPLPLALLVRVDNGSLDRPSHVERNPDMAADFYKTLIEYARLDAEYFAYRILFGAWSTSNYSLSGQMIDPETASFVRYRGPYYTASAKHRETLFGYEGGGFLKILHQLAEVKNIDDQKIADQFYKERRQHLGRCFLSLLGIVDSKAAVFFSRHQDLVLALSDQFEKLAKRTNRQKADLNLYNGVSDDQDSSLLDMSNLFRNFGNLYGSADAETKAIDYLVRKAFLQQIQPAFLSEIKNFGKSLFELFVVLGAEKCLGDRSAWHKRLLVINQNLPTMFELNNVLKYLAEAYRLGKIDAKILGVEIEKLCELPRHRMSSKI